PRAVSHRVVSPCLEHVVPFRHHGLHPPQPDLEPIQLANDLRLQMHRQGPAVTGPQVLQPLASTLVQWLVTKSPLSEEQPLDPVDVPHPLADQRPALAANTPAILLLPPPCPCHRTHPRLAPLEGPPG